MSYPELSYQDLIKFDKLGVIAEIANPSIKRVFCRRNLKTLECI